MPGIVNKLYNMKSSRKLIRITTVPVSLSVLLKDQLRYMSDHFEMLAVSSPDKILEQVGVREGVRTEPIVMTRAITPVKDIKSLWKLYRLLKKEKPAIVHTHTPKAGLLGMMASRLAGSSMHFPDQGCFDVDRENKRSNTTCRRTT